MIYYKKTALLLALISACQVQAAAHCNTVRTAALSMGAAVLGSLLVYKKNTSELLVDPELKQAYNILNRTKDAQIRFTYPLFEDTNVHLIETRDLTPREAYKLTWILWYNDGNCMLSDVEFFSEDSSVKLSSMLSYNTLFRLLSRVDSVEAPIFGFYVPILRRLANRITNP